MPAIGDTYKDAILDAMLGDNHASTFPDPVYVALFTSAPTSAGGGTECTGGSYARVSVANTSVNWPDASGGVKANGTDIAFPTATASQGTAVSFAIFDASSGGNIITFGDLTSPLPIGSGDTPTAATGTLTITDQ